MITCCSHISRSSRLYLLDALEFFVLKDFVKVGNDFVEQAKTLNALIIGFQLDIKFGEVRNGCKNYAHAITLFVV